MRFLNLYFLEAAALLLGGTFCVGGEAQTSPAPALAPFELRDQYETPHRISFPAIHVTLMTVADRKGSGQIDGWIGPIKERYGDRIAIEGVADMSSVPAPLRSFVRERFKKSRAYPVMLDWDGPVVRSFGYHKDEANLFVIDRQGRIKFHVFGATNPVALRQVFAAIDLALPETTP
jgi:hypothetical protein